MAVDVELELALPDGETLVKITIWIHHLDLMIDRPPPRKNNNYTIRAALSRFQSRYTARGVIQQERAALTDPVNSDHSS